MIFRKPGYEHINIPFAKPIKKHYVKKVFRDLWRGSDKLVLQTRSIKWHKMAKTKNTT